MTQIKGTSLRGVLKYAKEHDYPGGAQALVADLPPAIAEHFRRPVLSSAWYPYETYTALLTRLDQELGRGDGSLAPKVGLWAAQQDAGTIFKMVAFFASPERLLPMVKVFWSRYCDTGGFKSVDVEKGRGKAILADFAAIAPIHCRLLEGYVAGMGIATGGRNLSVKQTRCVHRGDDCCEYTATWS